MISIELLHVGSYEDDQLKVLKLLFCVFLGSMQCEPGMSYQVDQLGVLSVCQYHGKLTDSSGYLLHALQGMHALKSWNNISYVLLPLTTCTAYLQCIVVYKI